MTACKTIDGDNILYYYFRDKLIESDTEESRLLIRSMIYDLSIWLPIALYQRIPVLLPFVVRDPQCRKSVNKKREEWGSCNSDGYFRDDNTLIKAIPRRFKIKGKNRIYYDRKMGKGFVASHVWRELSDRSKLASRNPLTNTFVPNLVWLPRQLAKLTDIESSFAQKYLQSLSISIFGNVEMSEARSKFVEPIWKELDVTEKINIDDTVTQRLNFFDMSAMDIQNRLNDLLIKIEMIKNLGPGKFYCQRYFKTYKNLPKRTRILLASKLSEYEEILT